MATNVVVLLQSATGRRLVRQKCKAAGLDIAVLERLVHAELNHSGQLRKRGMYIDFDEIFAELDGEEEQQE